MADQITQQGRALKVYTPLDFDVLLIEKLSASEGDFPSVPVSPRSCLPMF